MCKLQENQKSNKDASCTTWLKVYSHTSITVRWHTVFPPLSRGCFKVECHILYRSAESLRYRATQNLLDQRPVEHHEDTCVCVPAQQSEVCMCLSSKHIGCIHWGKKQAEALTTHTLWLMMSEDLHNKITPNPETEDFYCFPNVYEHLDIDLNNSLQKRWDTLWFLSSLTTLWASVSDRW